MKAICSLILISLFCVGCASTIKLPVEHGKTAPPARKQSGTLALASFVDARGMTNAMLIGGRGDAANPKKPLFLVKQQKPLSDVVTDDFKEALEVCGYQVRTGAAETLPVLEGTIEEFWIGEYAWEAVCRISVDLELKDKANGQVLWKKSLTSEEVTVS
jgi:hypothetical protein